MHLPTLKSKLSARQTINIAAEAGMPPEESLKDVLPALLEAAQQVHAPYAKFVCGQISGTITFPHLGLKDFKCSMGSREVMLYKTLEMIRYFKENRK